MIQRDSIGVCKGLAKKMVSFPSKSPGSRLSSVFVAWLQNNCIQPSNNIKKHVGYLIIIYKFSLFCRLSRFEKTNEMLINFNILSANRFAVTSAQFRQNTQLLYDMKKDLDSIFKRIRYLTVI